MRTRYTALLGILGVAGTVLATRVASAGNWGPWVFQGTDAYNDNACGPNTAVGDNNDSSPHTVAAWAHTGSIRTQALCNFPQCEANNPQTSFPSSTEASGTTWSWSFTFSGGGHPTNYRCQNL
jgi:hypothetical protein